MTEQIVSQFRFGHQRRYLSSSTSEKLKQKEIVSSYKTHDLCQNLPLFSRYRWCFATRLAVASCDISASDTIPCELHNASGHDSSYAPSDISNSTYARMHCYRIIIEKNKKSIIMVTINKSCGWETIKKENCHMQNKKNENHLQKKGLKFIDNQY